MRVSGLTVATVVATAAMVWFSASHYASASSTTAYQPENWEISVQSHGATRVTQVILDRDSSQPVRHEFTRAFGSDVWEVKTDSGAIYARHPLNSTDPFIQETTDAILDGTTEVRAKWIGPGTAPNEVVLVLSPADRYWTIDSSTTSAKIEARHQAEFSKYGSKASEGMSVVKLSLRNEDAIYEFPIHKSYKPENLPALVNPFLVRIGQRVAGFSEFLEPNYAVGHSEKSDRPLENENLDPRNRTVDVGAVATSETGNPAAVMKYESPTIFPKLYGSWPANRNFELSHPARNNFQFDDSKLSRTYSEADLEAMITGKPDLNVLSMVVSDGNSTGPHYAALTIRVHAPFEFVSATPFRKVYGAWTRSSASWITAADGPISMGAVIGPEAKEEIKRSPRPGASMTFSELAPGFETPKLGISIVPSPTFPAGFIRALLKVSGSPVKSATPQELEPPVGIYGPLSIRGVKTLNKVKSEIEARAVTFERSITVREFGRNGFLGLRTIVERRAFSDLYPGKRKENYEVRMRVSLFQDGPGPSGKTLFYVYEDGSFEFAPENQTPGEQIFLIE